MVGSATPRLNHLTSFKINGEEQLWFQSITAMTNYYPS
jgi:hypothetical protein